MADEEEYALLRQLIGDASTVWSVAFSPDGSKIVSASIDQSIRIWDVSTGRPLLHLDNTNYWAFLPESSKIVSGSPDQS